MLFTLFENSFWKQLSIHRFNAPTDLMFLPFIRIKNIIIDYVSLRSTAH